MTTATMTGQEYYALEDLITDIFTNAVDAVEYGKGYKDLFPFQQDQARQYFFQMLNKKGITLTNEFVLEFQQRNSGSFLNKILATYKRNNEAAVYNSASKQLQEMECQKVTIISFSEWGMPGMLQTRVNSAKNMPYAQYSDSVVLKHTPKRKRTEYQNVFTPGEKALIYKGWINIDIHELTTSVIDQNDQVVTRQSKYRAFDKQYLTDVIAAYGEPDIQF